jgi:hypothetical protein
VNSTILFLSYFDLLRETDLEEQRAVLKTFSSFDRPPVLGFDHLRDGEGNRVTFSLRKEGWIEKSFTLPRIRSKHMFRSPSLLGMKDEERLPSVCEVGSGPLRSISSLEQSVISIFFEGVRSGALRDNFLAPSPSGVYWQFVEDPTNNENPTESERLIEQFEQLGKYFGKAFLSNGSITTGIPLIPAYYKMLLGQPITVVDIKDADRVLWETHNCDECNRFIILCLTGLAIKK